MSFTTHLPDLFAGDFLVDLASRDPEVWERSIAEVQRTIDITPRFGPATLRWTKTPSWSSRWGGFTKR